MKVVIGIDPGAAGGVVFLQSGHVSSSPKFKDMTPLGILKLFSGCDNMDTVAYLEDVGHGMPGQSSSATAKFARHCGHIEMALLAAGIPCVKVTPQKWMRALGLGSSKDYPTKVAWKKHLKERAEELFPNVKFTLATCDAALIAWYGYRQEREKD